MPVDLLAVIFNGWIRSNSSRTSLREFGKDTVHEVAKKGRQNEKDLMQPKPNAIMQRQNERLQRLRLERY